MRGAYGATQLPRVAAETGYVFGERVMSQWMELHLELGQHGSSVLIRSVARH